MMFIMVRWRDIICIMNIMSLNVPILEITSYEDSLTGIK